MNTHTLSWEEFKDELSPKRIDPDILKFLDTDKKKSPLIDPRWGTCEDLIFGFTECPEFRDAMFTFLQQMVRSDDKWRDCLIGYHYMGPAGAGHYRAYVVLDADDLPMRWSRYYTDQRRLYDTGLTEKQKVELYSCASIWLDPIQMSQQFTGQIMGASLEDQIFVDNSCSLYLIYNVFRYLVQRRHPATQHGGALELKIPQFDEVPALDQVEVGYHPQRYHNNRVLLSFLAEGLLAMPWFEATILTCFKMSGRDVALRFKETFEHAVYSYRLWQDILHGDVIVAAPVNQGDVIANDAYAALCEYLNIDHVALGFSVGMAAGWNSLEHPERGDYPAGEVGDTQYELAVSFYDTYMEDFNEQ